jgi:DNA-binding transcriptional MerR regulator
MSEPTYSTGQIARLIGVHPNTVRMYESWGMIPKPARKPNGYRVFRQVHIDQFRLARTAFQIEVLQSGLRKQMIDVVKLSARGQFDEAISGVKEYLSVIEKEKRNAEEAAEIAAGILRHSDGGARSLFGRKEISDMLGISMDTLRNWEMNGLLRVKRKENGYRIYDGHDIKTLKMIRSLRCANYSLAAILRMLHALTRDEESDIRQVVNTPRADEDIISVCDRLIESLDAARTNAAGILRMLHEMKKN